MSASNPPVLRRVAPFAGLALVILVFAVLTGAPAQYLSMPNLRIVLAQTVIVAIGAVGMTMIIVSGGIDLSVGSLMGLSAMIAGMLINQGIILPSLGIIIYPHTWLIMFIAVVVGMLMGAVSGFIITRFNVAPFIATLGMLYVARGMALLINNGYTFPNLVGRPELGNTGFPELGAGSFIVNYSIWIMLFFALVAAFVAQRTPFGRQVYAIGGNERAAELSGVKVKRVKLSVYVISGFCSAVVGLIIASQLVAAHPATGQFFELNAIAAVVLGGTSLSGGRGSIGGTIIGAFVIGVLGDGLVMVGVSSFWQQVIKGVVIVLAVIIDQIQARMQTRIALQKQQELG